MRLLHLAVPDDQRDAVVDAVRERDFGYVVTSGAADHEGHSLVSVVVPADAVEYVVEDLQEAGFDTNDYTVSIEAEFANFEGIDAVQDEWAKTPNRIAPQTLRSKAKDMRLNTRSYLWMMALSTVVAVAGLLLSSPAVVVGSMVLAPIVSPMLTASVGAVRNDRDMLVESVHMQALGLGTAVVLAVVVSFGAKYSLAAPVPLEVSSLELVAVRYSPGLLSVIVGLAAGAAGAFGLATKGQVSIVGVMIAAALIPSAAASGIGFAWGRPIVGVGALVLLVVTIAAVNVGGYLMLRYLGYRPDDVDEGVLSFDSSRQVLVVAATALVVLAAVVTVGVGTAQQFAFERAANQATTAVLDRPAYGDLSAVGVDAQFVANPFSEATTVAVTLSGTGDSEYPTLPNEIDRALLDRTGENVTVEVSYRDVDRSNVTARVAAAGSREPGTAPDRAWGG